ncbi:TorF family putative porin [Solimicrobium silvestre]|uniref:Uncharacterized protein n=1 Tax=Solimicrobium silvestre TaxID=2099400 RepID=A0A2S9GW59_9BURK|nr:TorF family putative porin [Solimicrobium silvestre]PRC91959.1 hypothetical protein S2091_3301 [Solimicrobium silvestre]
MKNKLGSFTAVFFFAVLSHNAIADEVVEAPKPDNEFSFNLGATSDYRYRGISQSNLHPAIQGGADYTNNPTGLYAGTWLSSIKWITDAGGSGDVEMDLYAGKRGDIVSDLSYDVGVLSYVYPGNNLGQIAGLANANTTEIYGQLTYKLANIKYSRSVTNLFSIPGSKNSGYVDLWTSIPVTDALALGLHVGHQTVENNSNFSYTDWKVGLSQDFFGVSFTLGVVGTDANKLMYVTPDGKFTGKTSLVLSAAKTF